MRSTETNSDSGGSRTGYDETMEIYHDRHEWDGDQPLASTIVQAVTEVTNDEPTAVDPLYEVIDPEVLEGCLRSLRDSNHRSDGTIHFTFNGRPVTVGVDGHVCVHCESGDVPTE